MARDVIFTILCIDRASHAMEKVGTKAEETGAKFGKLGKMAGTGLAVVGVAAAAVAVESVKLGMSFQSAMEQLATQAHVPQKEVDALSQSVLDLSGKVGVGPDSLAEALYHIESSFASTGITGAKAMHLLETASKGAKIGHADLVDVTNALDAAVVSGIPGVKNFDQAMGMLNATVGAGDMHMQDLAEAFGTGAVAVVKGYGLSLRDVGAALAVFGDNNIRGAQAGTQLRMTVQSLAVPAKGGAAALRELGLKSDTLAKAMAAGGLSGAVGLLVASLHKAGISSADMGKNSKKLAEDLKNGDLTKAMQDIGAKSGTMGDLLTQAFGKKAGVGLQMLVDQFDRLKSKYKEVDKGAKDFGASWKQQQATLQQQWDQLKDTADELLTKLGLKIIPLLTKAIPAGMKAAADGTKGLSDHTQGLVGWYHDSLLPAFEKAKDTILPALHRAIATVSAVFRDHQDVVRGVVAYFKILGAFITDLLIPAITANAQLLLAVLGPAFRAIAVIIEDVVIPVLRFLLSVALTVLGGILHGAADAFGWVPGIGGKLNGAAAAFDKFHDDVNAALAGITRNTVAMVNVRVMVNGNPVNISGNGSGAYNITGKGSGGITTTTVRAFATGGRPTPGQPSLVGENGPELFWPDTAGTIIPNHAYAARTKRSHPQMVAVGSSIISGVTDGLKQAAPKAYAFLRSFELKIADIKVSTTVRAGIRKAADRIGAEMVLTTSQVNDLTKKIADQKTAVADLFKKRAEYANTLAGAASGGGITNIGLLQLDSQGRNADAQQKLTDAQGTATDATQKLSDAQDHLNDLLEQQAARTSDTVAQMQALADAQKAVTDARQADTDAQAKLSTAQDTAKKATTNQATDYLDQLKARVRAIHTFSDDMNKLKAEGLSQSVLQQIAQAGLDTGGALAKALAEQGTPATIKAISSMDRQIQDSSKAFGDTWAGQMYNTGINAATGILKGLESKRNDLLAMIREMAQAVVNEIKRTLKIKSPSGVMADEVGAMIPAGIAAGMTANAHLVTTAARGMVPTGVAAYGGGTAPVVGGRGGDVHVHVHVQNGIVGDAAQVARYISDVVRRSNSQGNSLKFA